jgi:FkbM family methyltransferase
MSVAVGARASSILYRYYTGPDHPMKLRIWSWIRRSTGYAPLTIPYCGRGWIALDERDFLQREVLLGGLYEPEVWDALFSFAFEHEVLWDVGAHVGTFAVRSILDPRVSFVRAFEPSPPTRSALALNLRLNRGLGCDCRIHDEALGFSGGFTVLYQGPRQNTGMSSIENKPSSESYSVPLTSVDKLVFHRGLAPPTLMKVDVERSERDLFKGALRCLRDCPPKAIVFEADTTVSGEMEDRAAVEPLVARGYEIRPIKRPSGEVTSRENYLAVHIP